jgi:hypothetical protein
LTALVASSTERPAVIGDVVHAHAAKASRHGFPREASKALTEAMGVVIENPYDPLRALPTSDEQVRRVTFGDLALWFTDPEQLLPLVHDRLVPGGTLVF